MLEFEIKNLPLDTRQILILGVIRYAHARRDWNLSWNLALDWIEVLNISRLIHVHLAILLWIVWKETPAIESVNPEDAGMIFVAEVDFSDWNRGERVSLQ